MNRINRSRSLFPTSPLLSIHIVFLLIVTGLGFWLRTREITWGIPEVHSYMNRTMDALHPDESVLVQEATDLRNKGVFQIQTLRYPPLHAQITSLAEKWLFGAAPLWKRFLTARGVSIAASLASLILLYLIGLRWNPAVALIASAFFSVTMVAVRESHWANPEPLSAFWVLAALLFFVRVEKSQGKLLYVLMGSALALGIASKYFAVLFVHLPLLAIFLKPATHNHSAAGLPQRKPLFTRVSGGPIWAYTTFGLMLFLLLGIYIVKDPQMLRQAYNMHAPWALNNGLYGNFPAPVSVPTYVASVLPIALGLPLYLFSLAGIIMSVMARRRLEIMLAAAILPFWIFLEFLKYHPLRFSLSLTPVLCLFAAVFFNFIISRDIKLFSIIGTMALIVVFLFSGLYSYAFIDVLNPKKDARLLATEWLRTHLSDTREATILGVDLRSNSLGFIQYDGMDRLSGRAYDLTLKDPECIVIPMHVAHIFDQHRKLASEGYVYLPQDWAPMEAPTAETFGFYDQLSGKGYRQVAEFRNVPRCGALKFDSEPLKFDLALTNLEISIYMKR